MKKEKLFFVSPDTLEVKELKGFRRKFLGLFVGSVLVGLFVILATNHFLNDILGLGYNRIELLTNENKTLKQHVRAMTEKLATFDSSLQRLAERDNQLRLLVDLPRLDEDIREVGTGGAMADYEFSLSSFEVNEILRSSTVRLEKLEREIKLQRAGYDEVYRKFEFNKVFFSHIPAIKPMEGFYTPNSFGYRHHPLLQVLRFHEGLDLINDAGTDVYATGDGVVTLSGLNAGYGITIAINHGYGYQTLYAHLSKSLVRGGQKIKRGDLIGRSGHTGLASGPHLHYEVRLNGEKKNPVEYFIDQP